MNAAYAYQYYVQKGVPPHVAAGIVDNLQVESRFSPDVISGSRRGDSGSAAYAAQWRGPRLKNYERFASSTGRQAGDLNAQLDFVLEEMNPKSPYKDQIAANNARAIFTAPDRKTAALSFAQYFERPAAQHIPGRPGSANIAGALTAPSAATSYMPVDNRQTSDAANAFSLVMDTGGGSGDSVTWGLDDQPAPSGSDGVTWGLDDIPAPTPMKTPAEMAEFDPTELGAVRIDDGESDFDPTALGAVPLEGPPTPEPMRTPAEFEAMALEMDPADLAVERSKNTPFGAYLRERAKQPVEGESEADRNQRLYGSLPDSNADTLEGMRTFTRGMVEGVPVAGPSLLRGVENTAAGIGSVIYDRPYEDLQKQAEDIRMMDKARNPGTDTAGQVTGAVASTMALGGTTLGGSALGVTGRSLGGRALASGASGGTIAGADTLARGGNTGDALQSAALGASIGTAVPFLGAAFGGGYRKLKDIIGDRISPDARLAQSIRKMSDATGPTISAADDAAAAANGQPVLNVDRTGQAGRDLLRSAANVDSDAWSAATRAADDRFVEQAPRAQSFIRRITGDNVDDIALQERMRVAAQKANKPAYARAYNSPAAQELWDSGLSDLMRSPAMQAAVRAAEKAGKDRAVLDGFETIRNPFKFGADGSVTMKPGVKPTLRFWDQVKRNLDDKIGTAQRTGAKQEARTLIQLKEALTSKLDAAVPAYKQARAGAAMFFGAEDAIQAGKRFVTQGKDLRQTAKIIRGMTPEERKAFAVGFSAELIESIGRANDRTNVIRKIFKSPQAREKVVLALGKRRATEIEQFVRIEDTLDTLRGAMGNSTTARQLAMLRETGIAGGIGGVAGWATGDWKLGLFTAAAARGARYSGAKLDEKIAQRVAKLLLSENPADLQKAVTLAANNPKFAATIEAMQNGMGLIIRGLATGGLQPEQAANSRP